MKMRNGFVSNSSSSSFLIIGCDTSNAPDDVKEELIKAGFNDAGYYLDEEDFMGFVAKVSSDSGDEIKTFDIKKFVDIEQKIKSIVPNAKIEIKFGCIYG